MKTCIGVVTAEVYVECPCCSHEFNALDETLDGFSALSKVLFGTVGTPAKWTDLDVDIECPECCATIKIESLMW